MVSELSSIKGITCMMPSGASMRSRILSAYGLSAGNKKISSSGDLALYLLEEAKVALVHGEAFGDNDYVRLSYATSPDDIRRGIEESGKRLTDWKFPPRWRSLFVPDTFRL